MGLTYIKDNPLTMGFADIKGEVLNHGFNLYSVGRKKAPTDDQSMEAERS